MKIKSYCPALPVWCAVVGCIIGIASMANAQIGSSWTQFFPTGFLDYEINGSHHQHSLSSFTDQGARYTVLTGMERFEMLDGSTNRVEHDTDSHYNSGKRQFEGYVQTYPGVSLQSVVQIFGGGSGGPILMIKGYGRNNGALVVTRDTSMDLINNIFGTVVRVNLIHDVDAHMLHIYINGTEKWSGADAGTSYTGSYNVKYGDYGTFTSYSKVEWSSVKFFQGAGTQVYEAESLALSGTSDSTSIIADSNTSGGQFVQLNGTGVGDFFTFVVPNVPAATYDLRIGIKKNHNRAIVQTRNGKVGGAYSNFGPAFDEYSSSVAYTEVDLGNWTVSSSDKLVGFHVTGKNANSDGYVIGIDYIKLVPQF